MDESKLQVENSQSLDDWSKSQEALIAELETLRQEVASLKRSSSLSRQIIPPSVETISEIGLAEFPQSYTLLLLDDSETDRATHRRFLLGNSEKDCNIVEFDSAEEALIWCQDHMPDILLTDYLLPGINGLEFWLKLRERSGYGRIPCIIMTGQENQELAVQLLKGGAEDVLDKNRMTSEGLKRSIANVLQKKHLIRQQELQRERQHLINAIAVHSTDKSSGLSEIFQYTVDELRRLLQCDRVVLYQLLPDDTGKIITESVCDSTFSLLEQEIQDQCFAANQDWKDDFGQGKTHGIEDIFVNSHHASCYQEFLEQIQVRAKLSVPILQEGQVWGLIIVHQCTKLRTWAKAETELLNQIAIQISLAIQAVTLHQQAELEREERQKIEKIINEISTILVTKIGKDFFQELVKYLSQVLEVDYVFLAEITTPEMATTLAASYHQQIIDDVELDVQYPPCSEVLKMTDHRLKVYPDKVQELFPHHIFIQSAKIQSYLGIPLFNSEQKAIGLFVILHTFPLKHTQLAEEILKIVASRAGAELERQQIEAQLRESEADLLEAQEIAHVGHWKWNKLSNEVWWSREIYRIFGISPTQKITFLFFVEQIHPEDRDRVLGDIEATLEGAEYSNIYRICQLGGNIRFIQSKGQVIFDDQHNVIGMKGATVDITELKQVEIELKVLNISLEERVKQRTEELTSVYVRLQNELEERQQIEQEKQNSEEFYSEYLERVLLERKRIEDALSESEIRYRRIVETSSEGIWQLDQENKTVFVNPRMAEMLGCSVEEMLGKSFLNFLLETDKKSVDDLLGQLQTLIRQPYDIQFCRKDGSILWGMVSSRPIFDESGEYLGRLKMVTDISDRKKAEEILKFQSQILNEIHDAVITTNVQGIIQTWNHGAEELYEYTAEEMVGQNVSILYFAEDLQKMQTLVFDPLMKQERYQLELKNRTKSGREIYIRLRLSTIRDEDGNILSIIGCSNNISDRKQYEQDLLESTQFLETVLDSFPLLVAWKDLNLNYIGCNHTFAKACSLFSVSAIRGKNDENVPWIPLEKNTNHDRQIIQSGKAELGIIQKHLQHDGSIVWLETNKVPLRGFDGRVIGVLETSQDITSRKQNEGIVKEFNRRWRSVLDNIQMIVVELDRNGNVEYINPFFEKISQFMPEEVIGQNWFSHFIPSDLSSSIETVFQAILKDNTHEYYVNPIVTKSGEKRIIAWRTCVLKDDTGEAIGVISIGEDITEQSRLERMKSEFVSIVSHELKTPLTAMQASLSLLHEKIIDPLSEEGKEIIDIAADGVDRLVRLVDDILDLERLRSGKLTIVKTDCHTQNIIAGAIAQTQELAKRADTKFAVFCDSFSCYADCDRLVQVLTNLISNAIKFSPYQSTIELSIENKNPDPNQEIDAKPYLLFSVRDQGRGIPAQNLQTIFERFQQVDASDSREKGGTGLGLAICHDIIEQHGGKIWAESVLKEGSTFFFTIPIQSTEVTNDDN
jgi:PAS domain S-box-containing protein